MTATLADTSTLPIEPFVVDVLRAAAIAEGFSSCTLTTSAGSDHGDGFLSSVVRVHIAGQRSSGADASLSVICKIPPTDARRREEFGSAVLFRSEAHFYDTVAPMLARLEHDRRLRPHERFRTPRCLAVRCAPERAEYAIVLEDLRRGGGWQLRDKFAAVDAAHARCVAVGLARYHAVSLALRDQQPEAFERLASMENGFLRHVTQKADEVRAFFGVAWQRAADTLRPDGAAEERLRGKFWRATERFGAIVHAALRNDVRPVPCGRVIGHGDFWNNNMMFEYDEAQNPLRICLFDFQNAKLHSPAVDVLTYLFLSTDKPFRDRHMRTFLRDYHAALGAAVRRLGSDPERLYAWDAFEADLRAFGVFVVLMAPFMLQVSTAAAADVRRNEEALAAGSADTNLFYCASTAGVYAERMRGVLQTADECGYLACGDGE